MKSAPWTRPAHFQAIAVLIFASIACGSFGGGPTAPNTFRIPEDVTFGPGPYSLTDMRTGLDGLTSYKASLTYSFEGTIEGQEQQWTKTYIMITTQEPAARQLTIETSGDAAEAEPVFMAEEAGTTFERLGAQACTARLIGEGDSFSEWLEPALILTSVIGADESGTEKVNDIATIKYSFDERALGEADIAESSGEMWVAAEGGYVVRYLLTSQGGEDYFGEGIEGKLSWAYELTDVNQPLSISVPADCPAGLVDVPMLPDASNVSNMPSVLTYDTASSPAETAAFYEDQIPALGWSPLEKPVISEGRAFLGFARAGQVMSVIITSGEGVTRVHIVLERVEE